MILFRVITLPSSLLSILFSFDANHQPCVPLRYTPIPHFEVSIFSTLTSWKNGREENEGVAVRPKISLFVSLLILTYYVLLQITSRNAQINHKDALTPI